MVFRHAHDATRSHGNQIRSIFTQIGDAAYEIGVQLAGGHTEITPAVTQPVICGFMLGEAPTSATVSASGAPIRRCHYPD